MRLLVFGASGGTGKEIVARALGGGMQVTAFVRDPGRLDARHAQLRIVQGNVTDREIVAGAVAGQQAVISALGVGTPLKHDAGVIEGVRNIIDAMKNQGVRRLVYLSFIGVSESRHAAGWVVRHVARIPLRQEIADHEIKEDLVKASGLDWTLIRPCKLTNGAFTGKYRSGDDISARSLFPTLARADLAEFVLRQVSDPVNIGRAPRVLP
jgi:putative NADH-flavin reductase